MRKLLLLGVLGIVWLAYQGKLPLPHRAPKVPLDGVWEMDSPLIVGAVERVELRPDGYFTTPSWIKAARSRTAARKATMLGTARPALSAARAASTG